MGRSVIVAFNGHTHSNSYFNFFQLPAGSNFCRLLITFMQTVETKVKTNRTSVLIWIQTV